LWYGFVAVNTGLAALAFWLAAAVIGEDAFLELLVDRLCLIDLVGHVTSRRHRQRRQLQE
jgi:hypothetical protein